MPSRLCLRNSCLFPSSQLPICVASFQSVSRQRPFSQTFIRPADSPAQEKLSPRWLSDVKSRIGECIIFGLQPQQVEKAGAILKEITQDWRELIAGSEGFLTGPDRRGLYRRKVIWGEMVSAEMSFIRCFHLSL
jgi:hypothetical protein